MDGIIKKISDRLAGQSSRRGFVSTMGKVALGTAVAMTGAKTVDNADAQEGIKCCTGNLCSTSNKGPCPSGQFVGYGWTCTGLGGSATFDCLDCYTLPHGRGSYTCTFYHLRSA